MDLTDSDITDPTDFPASLPSLVALDAALRCAVCKDFFKGPVLLTCGHTFCSFCIREALSEHKECPSCRKPVSDQSLHRNTTLEEVVLAFLRARPEILTAVKPPELKRKRARSDSSAVAGPSVHRQDEDVEEASDDEVVEYSPSEGERQRSISPRKSKESTPGSAAPTSFVSCPICIEYMPMIELNEHLDRNCAAPRKKFKADEGKLAWQSLLNGKGKAKEKPRLKNGTKKRSPSPPPTRMVKHNYHIMSEKDIRALLTDASLSTDGSKKAMVARHSHFVTLFNANLDTMRPKSRKELIKELEAWEAGKEMDDRQKKKRKEKVEDTKQYEAANQDQFKSMINSIKSRPKPSSSALTTTSAKFALTATDETKGFFDSSPAPSPPKNLKRDGENEVIVLCDSSDVEAL
ncbi:hypothetical protein BOTBODRAFT_34557 [Botryobasidium botryosum FD-172 SS1]|uniref:Postreplication repair E3 ubiquitin-protein ligase RAD18 n=1 Tax=Botryobasidium botryosum (strain FD-172 SS1) TaxID=930990 RepID=A0A067MK86_BOTB1|nr:hypothetical protein BOTBODRAFT_34557 [Botryobasidium botryosum FD-172 SS1]